METIAFSSILSAPVHRLFKIFHVLLSPHSFQLLVYKGIKGKILSNKIFHFKLVV